MNKPSDKQNNDEQKISTVSNPIECKHAGCSEWALSLSKYCWEHMPKKEKAKYKQKIEDWHKSGKSLNGFILNEADLSGAKLWGADLSKANLYTANLSKAVLIEANLSEALLREANLSGNWMRGANLSESDLWGADLSRANLEIANLSKAVLIEANLSEALLREADLSGNSMRGADLSGSDLWGADLSKADLNNANLEDVTLIWANLINAKGLRINCFTEKLSDKEKEEPSKYQESYLFVKNYFLRMGSYDDASEAAYREKMLQRLSYSADLWNEMKYKYYRTRRMNVAESGLLKFFQRLKYIMLNPHVSLNTFFKVLGSRLIDDLCGYGEKPKLTVRAAFEIIGFFAVFYWLIGKFEQSLGLIDSLYFSVVTFTTLGLGDIKPLASSLLTRIAVASEALIGAFMIALFVWTLARRGAAR